MNKRTFLKLSSATIASPTVMRLLALAGADKLTNWAGNLEYSTENLYAAKSIEQVQDFVKKQAKLKVLGSRHCFNNIADSKDAFLSLKPLDEIVSLALGVITKITLDIQPTYEMRQYVYENLSFTAMKDHFDAIQASAYSVSLFTDWQNHNFSEVWLKTRTEKDQAFNAKPEFFGAKLATKNLHPIAELSAENCTQQMGLLGPWFERLPHFRMGFTPSAGKELQSEYFVPRHHAVEAILAVERLRDQITPHLLITEIRAIAADDLWMSPCYQQPCVTIHFTWKQDWPAVSQLLPVLEKELAPFQARPHWGKLFTMPTQQLHSHYKKLPEFIALTRKFDPNGKFHNDFLNTNIFS